MRTLFITAAKTSVGFILNRAKALRLLQRGRVLLLAYHRVLPSNRTAEHPVEPGMYVTDATFHRHLEFLKARCDILSMHDWLDSWSNGGLRSNGRYCVITFDDGWRDNYDFAFPVLQQCRVPATIFLVTSLVGTHQWYWTERATFLLANGDLPRLVRSPLVQTAPPSSPWAALRCFGPASPSDLNPVQRAEALAHAIERLKEHPLERLNAFCDELSAELRIPIPSDRIYLSWEEIQEMSARGIAFGSHSHTHPILTRIPLDRVPSELEESRRILVSRRLNFAPAFCYPNGNFSPQTKALVQQAGYRAAVTTQDGTETLAPADPFAIRRVCMHEDVTRNDPLLTLRLVTACAASRSHGVAP